MACVVKAHTFPHVSANMISGPANIATSVVSIYFTVYVHLSLHLLWVTHCHAMEASCPATLVLADVGHRLVLLFSQCALSNLE